jgi:hypothetical protein
MARGAATIADVMPGLQRRTSERDVGRILGGSGDVGRRLHGNQRSEAKNHVESRIDLVYF